MKRINIYPGKYQAELNDLINNVTKQSFCTVKIYDSYIQLIWENPATDNVVYTLMLMLFRVVMFENPIYRHSPRLRDLAWGLIDTDLHKTEEEKLKQFLKSHKELNIEGYVVFRMELHQEKLDMMLYSIVKKINSSKY